MSSKSTGIAYVLWFFFGGVGAHKFYLGRPGVGALYIGMFVLFWAGVLTLLGDAVLAVQQGTSFASIAPLMAAPLSLALTYDLITMPSQVRAANARLGSESSAGSTFQGARREASYGADREEQFAAKKADEIVARYIARQAQAAAPVRATPTRSAPAGAPTFGRRGR
jgi:TM2 domain-containing membrane protein YozV